MIKKLRRKFVAAVMGAAAAILLAVFAVLAASTETGMRRQTADLLEMSLNRGLHKGGYALNEEKDKPAVKDGPQDDPGRFRDRRPCFNALVREDGSVTLEDRAEVLLGDFDTEEIQQLARSVAFRKEDSGALSAYRLRYAKRAQENGVLVAFADVSQEYNNLMELIKNSLVIGALALLAIFGASARLARWAVRPVEKAWNQQKQFVGDASHELKTPLTVILSNADMILSHPEEPSGRWAENIKAEAQRMKDLTQELLSLARSDDDSRRPVLERTDLSYLVTDSALSFEPAAFESGRELISQVEPGLFVLGDPASLTQLCGILLDNAVKYASPSGKIRVTLEAAGKSARLSVANEGEPIPQEELSRLFERFYRADSSRHSEGYGLGLAIARRIAEVHRGKIWAQSGEGENAFIVLLPLEKR